MKKSIHIRYGETFDRQAAIVAQAGFSHIALCLDGIVGKASNEWDAISEHIRSVLEKNKLSCNQTHAGSYFVVDFADHVDEALETAFLETVRVSAAIGAEQCVFHPRPTRNFSAKDAIAANAKFFSSYLEAAHRYGTSIAVENMPIFGGMRPINPLFGHHPEQLCALVDHLNDDRMGVCLDFGHANLVNISIDYVIETLGPRLTCTHVHNNMHREDDHLPLDQGEISWEKAIGALYRTNYKGALTLETACRYNDETAFAAYAKHGYDSLVWLEGYFKA